MATVSQPLHSVNVESKKVFLTEAAQTCEKVARMLPVKAIHNIESGPLWQQSRNLCTVLTLSKKVFLTEAAQTSATTMLVEALTSSAPIVSAQVEPLAIQTATEYLGQKHLCLHVFL